MNSWDDMIMAGQNVDGPIGGIFSFGVNTVNTGANIFNNLGKGLENLSGLLSGDWFYIIILLLGGYLVVDLIKSK
jgi:hypothetical protein